MNGKAEKMAALKERLASIEKENAEPVNVVVNFDMQALAETLVLALASREPDILPRIRPGS